MHDPHSTSRNEQGYFIEFARGWWQRKPGAERAEKQQTFGKYAGDVTLDQAKELEHIVSDYLTAKEQPPRLTAYGMRDFIARAIAYWAGQPGEYAKQQAEEMRAFTRSESVRSDPIGPATAAHDKMVWDAARYRWLRSGRIDAGVWRGERELTRMQALSHYCESALDEAIDRGMSGGKP